MINPEKAALKKRSPNKILVSYMVQHGSRLEQESTELISFSSHATSKTIISKVCSSMIKKRRLHSRFKAWRTSYQIEMEVLADDTVGFKVNSCKIQPNGERIYKKEYFRG